MYFLGLQEWEKMVYATRVEALRRRFGQETDTSIALQELTGLRRGKDQSAKELADSARCLASRAYHTRVKKRRRCTLSKRQWEKTCS